MSKMLSKKEKKEFVKAVIERDKQTIRKILNDGIPMIFKQVNGQLFAFDPHTKKYVLTDRTPCEDDILIIRHVIGNNTEKEPKFPGLCISTLCDVDKMANNINKLIND